jgi:hypothetical protein
MIEIILATAGVFVGLAVVLIKVFCVLAGALVGCFIGVLFLNWIFEWAIGKD